VSEKVDCCSAPKKSPGAKTDHGTEVMMSVWSHVDHAGRKREARMEEPIEPRVEQRIEHNETKMDYNHHTLWLRSYALKAGGWMPKVVVIIPEEEGNGEHEIQGESTFIEREEADKQAFLMGKAWIDHKAAGDIPPEDISKS
jgi:hypothetical protein